MDIVSHRQISVQLLVWCLPSKIYPQQHNSFIYKKSYRSPQVFWPRLWNIENQNFKLKLSNRSLALIFEGQKFVEQEIKLVWPK